MFRKDKTHIIATFHGTDLVICSHSKERKTLSYGRRNTVLPWMIESFQNGFTLREKIFAPKVVNSLLQELSHIEKGDKNGRVAFSTSGPFYLKSLLQKWKVSKNLQDIMVARLNNILYSLEINSDGSKTAES